MHQDSENVIVAREYLRGKAFRFSELYRLWNDLKEELEFGYARQVLTLLRKGTLLVGDEGPTRKQRLKMTQQLALCTSKDPDLSAAERHDAALKTLKVLGLGEEDPDGGPETLGIAGGICKRKWEAFGQVEDLKQSLRYYEQGYEYGVAKDFGYTAINTAFVLDLLVHLGERPEADRERAREIRGKVVDELPGLLEKEGNEWLGDEWWFYVTLAEACLGLGRFDEGVEWVRQGVALEGTPLWEFETTARQFVALASLQPEQEVADTRGVLQELVRGRDAHVDDVLVGKVGLALSGGGFRASLYHLGVLARLAELDVLRHVQVLSCVSGGSIAGALYYLALRARLMDPEGGALSHRGYVELVQGLIQQFKRGMTQGVLEDVPEGLIKKIQFGWRALKKQGFMDPKLVAEQLETAFYRFYTPELEELTMDAINLTPADHDEEALGPFHPKRHNWLRRNKVPALVLNATTVNTGHCWQFTTMSMGETPFALHEEVDGVPRLRRAWYRPATNGDPGRRIGLGGAVAASAAVPGIFQPLTLEGLYPAEGDPYNVRLVDGGVFDNQGIAGLLAADCNVLIVSDAAGQLTQENHPPEGVLQGGAAYAGRAVSMLMERIRQSGYSELKTREQASLLRGLMFIHMKDGLYAEPVAWAGCQESYQPPRQTMLTPSGVRRDFQEKLAELRTHLDDFTPEADYLMACGYQMAESGFAKGLAGLPGLAADPLEVEWEFAEALRLITSTDEHLLARQQEVLDMLSTGVSVDEEGD